MKIAFLSSVDTSMPANAANRDTVLAGLLRDYGHEIFPVIPKPAPPRLDERLFMAVLNRLGVSQERCPVVLRQIARTIEKELQQRPADLVLALSTLFMPWVKTKLPVVTWSDATFESSINFYEWHTGLDPISLYFGHSTEERSLKRSTLTIVMSQWAAVAAARRYRFPIERLRVLPGSTNLPEIPNVDMFRTIRNKKSFRLVMVGVEWQRKGGDVALDVLRLLGDSGVSAGLDYVGMVPPKNITLPANVSIHPRLNKAEPKDWKKFQQIMMESDVMLLPTRADFSPNVIPEAYAFGLPVVAAGIAGIPELIQQGRTGFIVKDASSPQAYLKPLLKLARQPEFSADMGRHARAYFETHLSSEIIVNELNALLEYALEVHHS